MVASTIVRDHTMEIRSGPTGSELVFAPVWNAAVAFVDRHLEEGRADRVAVRDVTGAAMTFGDLARECDRWGRALLELGLRPGDRQLMIVLDCLEFFYLFWGAIKAGIVPVPVNTLLRAKDYRYMIEDSGCAALVYSPELAAEVKPAVDEAATPPRFVLDVPATRGLGSATASALAPHRSAPTDDCFWLYSSGSTGFPKGAVHAHRAPAVTSQRYAVETLGIRADDVVYSAAKLFFAYGLGNSMTFPLWVGASSVLSAARPTPEAHLRDHRALPPEPLLRRADALRRPARGARRVADACRAPGGRPRRPDLSSLRYCVSAGEALPPALFERWRERTGLLILDCIGSTEALHMFIANTPREWKPGTSGKPLHGYEARIVDDDGSPVAPGSRALSTSAASRPRSTTGTNPRRRARRCSPTVGSRPATPTARTRTASSSTRAAPTT